MALGLEDMLNRFGCQVVGPISRVAPAVNVARAERLDGAILDVNVRGHLIFPVADELRVRGIPFIFSTGYSETSVVLDRFRGAARLEKPYDEQTLQQFMLREFVFSRKPKMSSLPSGEILNLTASSTVRPHSEAES